MTFITNILRYVHPRRQVWYFILGFNIFFVCVLLMRIQFYTFDYPITKSNISYNTNTTIVSIKVNQSQSKNRGIYIFTNDSTKYILLWTSPKYSPFVYFEQGRKIFVDKKCSWNNCYVTGDRQFLGDYVEFDVVAFNGPQLSQMMFNRDFPTRRYSHQKYVYANIEAADSYPILTNVFDNFFNWTWTYKLNSDAVWGYFIIRNAHGTVIGPSDNMHWLGVDKMKPIDRNLQAILKKKSKIAIWIASNCQTQSLREDYVKKVQYYLDYYNLIIDTYGDCGVRQCPRNIMDTCLKMARNKYYFYFAFENAFSDDYITEKVVYALNYNMVPVVYGGANYSKFLPDGAYLDALKLGPRVLVQTMVDLMQDLTKYSKFFRWKQYYSYHFTHQSPDTDVYCKFCEILHNSSLMKSTTVYGNMSKWWMDKVDRTANRLYAV